MQHYDPNSEVLWLQGLFQDWHRAERHRHSTDWRGLVVSLGDKQGLAPRSRGEQGRLAKNGLVQLEATLVETDEPEGAA